MLDPWSLDSESRAEGQEDAGRGGQGDTLERRALGTFLNRCPFSQFPLRPQLFLQAGGGGRTGLLRRRDRRGGDGRQPHGVQGTYGKGPDTQPPPLLQTWTPHPSQDVSSLESVAVVAASLRLSCQIQP